MNRVKAFTLIELLVVIGIIGILSSVILASLNTARAKARDAKRISDLHSIQIALQLYFDATNNTTYPVCYFSNGAATASCTTTTNGGGSMSSLGIIPNYIVPNYLPVMPNDPTNVDAQYGYYYARGYKPTGPSSYTQTNSLTDYILATRLENSTNTAFSGWNNGSLNYLIGD